jgi:hypothetical protein
MTDVAMLAWTVSLTRRRGDLRTTAGQREAEDGGPEQVPK